jgi:hypothetical protein
MILSLRLQLTNIEFLTTLQRLSLNKGNGWLSTA